LIVAWGLHHGLQSRPSIRPFAAIAAVLILGSCLVLTRIQLAHWRDGIALFTQAVRATKNNFAAHNILGVVLANAGRTTEAITQYEEALRLKPDDVESHYHLGLELMDLGKFSEAGWHFSEALKRMPDNVVLLNNLGVALAQSGEPAGAGERFRRAIQLSPEYPKPYFNYGKILAQLGQNGQAFTNFMTALRLEPDWPEALNQAARFLATCPESKWRNPSQAMACAERANEITGHESPVYLETLALTWAVNGNFSNAVSTAELAVQKARAGNPGDLADKIAGELNVYRTGQIPQMDKTAPSAYKAPHP
jgi:Flp pilus assembly protein TadD